MKKGLTVVVWLGLLILVGFYIVSNLLSMGQNLDQIHPYLKYFVYGLSAVLFYLLLARPLFIVLFAPYYSVSRYCDENQHNDQGLRKRAKRLLKHGSLEEHDKEVLKEAIKGNKNKLKQRMYIIYNNQIVKNINQIVVNSAKDTLVVTGVSQNSFVDGLTVLTTNFRMIKNIVLLCGFRPTFLRTIKLYINVFIATLIADGAQKVEISSFLSTTLRGGAKLLTDSAFNGAVNAFFVLRIGMLTKRYLYAENPKKDNTDLRNNSIVEAMKLFPNVLTSIITSPIKSVSKLFKKKDHEEVEEDELDADIKKVKWHRK